MTICAPPSLAPGSAVLTADGLTDLSLDCGDGYVLVGLTIGFPSERPVVRARALADGVFDDTTYLGPRVITATLRLDHRILSTQTLIDRLMPFLSPRRRPTLTWALAGSPTEFRSAVLRGVDAPLVIDGPKYRTVVAQWVTEGSFLLSASETCVTIDPLNPEPEEGREYDLTFDRIYVPTPPVGGIYVYNAGTAPANWTITLTASMTNPTVTVGTTAMVFNVGGGLTLYTGQTLVIDTLERTILLNGDPTQSRYDRVNFEDWLWEDLLLQPGLNLVRLTGTGFDFTSRLTICWRDHYL